MRTCESKQVGCVSKSVLTCLSGTMTKPQNRTHHGQFALYVCRESITISGL